MIKEIRIYIEGGGDSKNNKSLLRQGFNSFFKDIVQMARDKKIGWQVIMCGSRNSAFEDFKTALKIHPDAFNILLVDSEAPVDSKNKNQPWKHLQARDSWEPPGVDSDRCHLMVQAMEAWFIADIDALKSFYGGNFKENSIPKNTNVENIDKFTLEPSLKTASRDTTKGEYHKIKHGSQLLALIKTDKVRQASKYSDRLFQTIFNLIKDTDKK